MSEFRPVSTGADLDTLSDVEVVAGFLSGVNGEPEPGNTQTRSFWHGWRVGMVRSGRCQPDAAQQSLERVLVARGELACMQGAMQ